MAETSSKMQVLVDGFGIADLGIWDFYDAGATVSGGQLRIVPSANDPGVLADTWDGTNSWLVVQLVQAPTQGSGANGTDTGFGFEISAGNSVYFLLEQGTLYFQETVGGTANDTNVAYVAATDKWWKITTSGTTLSWWTSADGVNWTQRRTKTSTLNFAAVRPAIYCSVFGTLSVGTAIFDNFNLPPDPAQQWVCGSAPMGAVDGTLPTDAGTRYSWGAPTYFDDFTGNRASVDTNWDVYNGPGHAGNGTRAPAAITVASSLLTITGTAGGQSGGMMKNTGQVPPAGGKYEVRMRTAVGSQHYHPVLLLWPYDDSIGNAVEVDFCEILDSSTRSRVHWYLHDGNPVTDVWTSFNGPTTNIDATQWHNYALEWTASAIVTYIDGVEVHRFTSTANFPKRDTRLCIQLDNFSPDGSIAAGGVMDVDWVKIW